MAQAGRAMNAVKQLTADSGRSFNSLVEEAVQDLLKKYQKKGK
jgi:hypothetical protein